MPLSAWAGKGGTNNQSDWTALEHELGLDYTNIVAFKAFSDPNGPCLVY